MSEKPLEVAYGTRAEFWAQSPQEPDVAWGIDLIKQVRACKEGEDTRPCAYAQWTKAFEKAQIKPHFLLGLAERISRPRWTSLIALKAEFALSFLEADIMQFRSGYTKRHLIKRLGQAKLSEQQHLRAEGLIRRAIVGGAGQEEFRAYCGLAARLQTASLTAFSSELCKDVRLNYRDVGRDLAVIFKNLSNEDSLELIKGHVTVDATLARVHPKKGSPNRRSLEQMIARNAWRVLRSIKHHSFQSKK